jgi:uncharacterized membrane protein YfcA
MFAVSKFSSSLVKLRSLSTKPPEGPLLPHGTSLSFLVFLTGTFAGSVGSLVGMGGAFVALPFLSGYFALRPHIAHGTSMAAVLATSVGGSLAYIQRDAEFLKKFKSIDWQHLPTMVGSVHLVTAGCVALSSSITVIAGARIAQMMSGAALKKAMGVFMLAIAPTVPLRGYLKEHASNDENKSIKNHTMDMGDLQSIWPVVARPLGIGACSGLLAGIFGVGGGAITVPALTLATDLDYQVALGTSLAGTTIDILYIPFSVYLKYSSIMNNNYIIRAAMIPTAISGCIAHIRHGTMRAPVALPLAAGCLLG